MWEIASRYIPIVLFGLSVGGSFAYVIRSDEDWKR